MDWINTKSTKGNIQDTTIDYRQTHIDNKNLFDRDKGDKPCIIKCIRSITFESGMFVSRYSTVRINNIWHCSEYITLPDNGTPNIFKLLRKENVG